MTPKHSMNIVFSRRLVWIIGVLLRRWESSGYPPWWMVDDYLKQPLCICGMAQSKKTLPLLFYPQLRLVNPSVYHA